MQFSKLVLFVLAPSIFLCFFLAQQPSKLALFVLALSVFPAFFLAQQPSKLVLFVTALSIFLAFFFSSTALSVGLVGLGSFHSFPLFVLGVGLNLSGMSRYITHLNIDNSRVTFNFNCTKMVCPLWQ